MKTATATAPCQSSFTVKTSAPAPRILALRESNVHSLDLSEGECCQLSVRTGMAWVTMEGNPDDFALTAGSPRTQFTGPGRLVIEAVGDGVTLQMNF